MSISKTLFVGCLVPLLLTHNPTAANEASSSNFRYLSMDSGSYKIFTQSPNNIKIGMKGGDPSRRDIVYSIIRISSMLAGASLSPSSKFDDSFVGVVFSEKFIDENGISPAELKNSVIDGDSIKILKKSFTPGKQCLSATVYSENGRYLRSFIISNTDVENLALADCAIDVSAHLFGIATGSYGNEISFMKRFSVVNQMIEARKHCIDDGIVEIACAEKRISGQ